MDAQTLFEAIVRGAVTGLGSGLLAVALVITFRTTRVLNFALGGIASVAAFTMSTLWGAGDVPLVPALLIVLALGGALGLAGERALRPLAGASVVVKAVAALGLLLVTQAAIALIWGPGERFLPLLLRRSVGSGGLRLGHQQLLAAGAALFIGAAIILWTARTRTGTATLALAEDVDAARLLGIRTGRVSALVWTIAGVVAALAGVLLSGLTVVNTTEMTLALVAALAAALLAGFESVPLAVGASAGVGAVTAAAASFPELAQISGFVESVGFLAVIIVVLIIRPRQIAGSMERA
ncbi:MAG: branched-chain amino acid ABC transporter permease [Actinomycetota bacterium]